MPRELGKGKAGPFPQKKRGWAAASAPATELRVRVAEGWRRTSVSWVVLFLSAGLIRCRPMDARAQIPVPEFRELIFFIIFVYPDSTT